MKMPINQTQQSNVKRLDDISIFLQIIKRFICSPQGIVVLFIKFKKKISIIVTIGSVDYLYRTSIKVIEHRLVENHKIIQMLTILLRLCSPCYGHALQHIKCSNALVANREVLKSLKFYPQILT